MNKLPTILLFCLHSLLNTNADEIEGNELNYTLISTNLSAEVIGHESVVISSSLIIP